MCRSHLGPEPFGIRVLRVYCACIALRQFHFKSIARGGGCSTTPNSCLWRSAQCALLIALCSLRSAHCALLTALCAMRSAQVASLTWSPIRSMVLYGPVFHREVRSWLPLFGPLLGPCDRARRDFIKRNNSVCSVKVAFRGK